jgi:hypothetical protein
MPIPRVRFTVRRIMAAVAAVALIAGGLRMRGLSVAYRELADSNTTNEEFYRVALSGRFKLGHPSYERTFRDRLVYHQLMRKKYDRAARYPWLPVWPDPPEPE